MKTMIMTTTTTTTMTTITINDDSHLSSSNTEYLAFCEIINKDLGTEFNYLLKQRDNKVSLNILPETYIICHMIYDEVTPNKAR